MSNWWQHTPILPSPDQFSPFERYFFGLDFDEPSILRQLSGCHARGSGPLLGGSSHRGVVTQAEQARIEHAEQVELEALRAAREARSRREIEATVRRFEERQAEKRDAAEERQARKRALAAIIPIPPTTSPATAVSPGWIAHMASGRIPRRS
jgi:hypothetical protein